MRVVNLAKKPFINRRPVVRVAAFLWALGGLLLVVNLFLYRDHWQGTADNRKLLAESEQSLREGELRLEEQDRQLTSLDLRTKNREAAFLNGLISQRTFPWSTLFDHLERVTPIDVRLVTVQPVVQLAGSDSNTRTRRRSSRRSSDTSVWAASTADNGQEPDEVSLRLNGWSKTEEALTEFIDTLYQDPSFRRILLRNEALENEGGRQSIRFNLEVLFLTGATEENPEILVAETEAAEDPEDDEIESLESEDTAPEAPTVQAAAPPVSDDEDDPAPPVIAQTQPEPESSLVAQEVAAARRESSPPPSRVEIDEEEADEQDEGVEEDRASLSRRQRLEALRSRSRERAAARNRRQSLAEEAGRRSAIAAGLQVGPGAVVGGRVEAEDDRQGGGGDRGNQRQGNDSEFPDRPASSTPGVSWLLPDWMPQLEDFGLELGLVFEEEAEG